jgi:hypothetical protein
VQQIFEELGAVEAVKFNGVDPQGSDQYHVTFEHGAAEFTIRLGPDGKIVMAAVPALPMTGAMADHAGASRARRCCFTPGHSAATMEKRAESRGVRSDASRCARSTPSNCAPMRSSAARERSLRTSV